MNYLYFFCLGSLLFFVSADSKPSLEELCGIGEVINQCQLPYWTSPWRGAVAVEMPILKNRYLKGDRSSSLVKVIRRLFSVEAGGEFDATTYEPYKYFNPRTIAVLTSFLVKKKLGQQTTDELISSVVHNMGSTMQRSIAPSRLQQLIHDMDESIEQEEGKIYPEGAVAQALLGFLYLKSSTAGDIINYVTYLSDCVCSPTELLNHYRLPNWTCWLLDEALDKRELLKNNYLSSDRSSAYFRLLRQLFGIDFDGRLVITTNEPYRNFNVNTVAVLVAFLLKKKLAQEFKGEITQSTGELALANVVQDVRSTFNGGKVLANLPKFIQIIEQGLEAEQCGLFPEGTVAQALFGFLYLKYGGNPDLVNYITLLGAYLGRKYEPVNVQSLSKKWRIADYIRFSDWLKDEVTDDSDGFIQGGTSEYFMYCLAIGQQVSKARPSMLFWQRNVPYKNYLTISDCAENALRSFFNELFYDDQLGIFTLNCISPDILALFDANFKNFYSTYPYAGLATVNNPQARVDFVALTANIPGVIYMKHQNGESYEVIPTVKNFFSIVGYFCGFPISKTCALEDYIRSLCEYLSSNAAFELKLRKYKHNDQITDIEFEFRNKKLAEDIHYFALHLREEHAWITRNDWVRDYDSVLLMQRGVISKSNQVLLEEKVQRDFSSIPMDMQLYDQASLLGYGSEWSQLTSLPDYLVLSGICGLSVEIDDQRYRCFLQVLSFMKNKGIITVHQLEENVRLCSFLYGILHDANDSPILAKCFATLIIRNFYTMPQCKALILAKLPTMDLHDQQVVLLQLARKKTWHDEDYRKILVTSLANRPGLEKDEDSGFQIDNRLLYYKQLLSHHVHEDAAIRAALLEQLNSLDINCRDRFVMKLRLEGGFESFISLIDF